MTDLVNHPAHYITESGLEVIDIIEQILGKYDHRDQVVKYTTRAHKKGNFIQDLQKAEWYLNRTVQNALKGKIVGVDTGAESFNQYENKVAIQTHEESVEETEPAHEYDRSKVYMDAFDCLWKWFDKFETWAWGTTHEDCLERAEHFNGIPVKYAEPWESEAPYTVVEDNYDSVELGNPNNVEEFEFKVLEPSTIEELIGLLADTVETEEESSKFDKDYLYTDSDGDVWGWISEHNTWSWGHDPEARSLRATIYADIEDLCAEPKPLFGPFTKKEIAPSAKKETKPKYDKEKVWKDKDGDSWECIEGAWVTGDTHEERVESGHEMLEFGSYYTNLPEDYAPYTEVETRRKFDETRRYIDSDGDIWAFSEGFWYYGHSNQRLEEKFGVAVHQWHQPCVDIENCKVVDTAEHGPAKLYKDRDGDVWECINGLWVFGRNHERRVDKRIQGYGAMSINEEFAPFVEIEDENGETV